MRIVIAVALAGAVSTGNSTAQDLVVHVVTNTAAPKPMPGVSVQLFPQPSMPGRRKIISERSNANGVVVFHDIDLSKIAWSVSVWNIGTAATDPVILCKPENAQAQGVRPSITSLPAQITLHVRRRGFREQLAYLFLGP